MTSLKNLFNTILRLDISQAHLSGNITAIGDIVGPTPYFCLGWPVAKHTSNSSMAVSKFGFLFDMDGVICDNNSFHRLSWLEYASQLGKSLTEADFVEKVYGKTNRYILEYVLGRPVNEQELHFHAEAKEALFRLMYKPHFTLTQGLETFLHKAKEAGIALGLATNATESNLNFSWEMGRLNRYFTVKGHPGLVSAAKPAPDLYLYVAEKLGVSPENCVVFEDSKTGIQAAQAAGAKVVGVASTLPMNEISPLVDWVITDFTSFEPEDCLALFHDIIL